MRARLSIVNVQYDDGDNDAQPDQYHGEEQILAEQWQCQRCGRYNFGYQQEEHGLRQQNANAQGNLFAGIGGQVENEHGQVRDANARNDQVNGVEKGFAA